MKPARRIHAVPEVIPAIARACAGHDPGGAALENHERIIYQSMRTKGGIVAPLPLTYADALAEAYPALPKRDEE